MSKTSVFLPLAFEFDPENLESLQESFQVTDSELFNFMTKIGRMLKNDEVDNDFAQKTFVPMIQNGEVSANLLILFAANGALEFWKDFCDGITLMLDAEKEKNDAP